MSTRGACGLLLPWLAACVGVDSGHPVSPTVFDLDGIAHRPLAPSDGSTVLVFVTTDCPIANSYAPEIAAIVRDHAGLPVRFFLVHVDADLPPQRAREHARDFGLPGPVLLDPGHVLVAGTGVTMTPEAVVLDADATIVYRGRIDDAWAELGRRRTVVGSRDLRNAVAAALAGRQVPAPWPEAVGCTIR